MRGCGVEEAQGQSVVCWLVETHASFHAAMRKVQRAPSHSYTQCSWLVWGPMLPPSHAPRAAAHPEGTHTSQPAPHTMRLLCAIHADSLPRQLGALCWPAGADRPLRITFPSCRPCTASTQHAPDTLHAR